MRYGIVTDAMLAMWERDLRQADLLDQQAKYEDAGALRQDYYETVELNRAIARQQLGGVVLA